MVRLRHAIWRRVLGTLIGRGASHGNVLKRGRGGAVLSCERPFTSDFRPLSLPVSRRAHRQH